MKRKILSISIGVTLCLTFAPVTFAQTADNSVLYTANVDLSSLTQNSFVGTVGGIFLTTYSYYPELNYLGYADPTGAPLASSHLVTLWDNSTQSVIASATVAAGTAAPLLDGYRWVQLSSTVNLNYGSYYVIGAQTDGVDLWGDLISNSSPDNGNNGQITWSSQYVQLGSGWEFTRAGRYDSAGNYPSEPPNQTSMSDSIYPAANLGYNLDFTSVPEPASLGLLGFGATLFFGLARKWKKN
ncbi:MAG TPA: PEP-CTERM sorting domain-containing protein [Phycisphaerae bacterium]|nr:PEP-CTERM sorting domain-containing protein [Phycisphaerae bacterium]